MVDTFLRLREAMKVTGLTRSSVVPSGATRQVSQIHKLSERCCAWSAAEIEQWMDERIAKRDSKSGA